LSNLLNTKTYRTKAPSSQSIGPAATTGVGGAGPFTNRLARNELRGYRRWGYPGAFAMPAAMLWAEAALVDAEDDQEDMEAVEEDLWGS
jgi:hypothetical protein